MNIVFMGTPDFAVPCLERLVSDGHTVSAVFSQPDKPKGRKMILAPTPVKQAALNHGITVYQPASMKTEETIGLLRSLAPELIVVVAFGRILPKEILSLPKYGCVNVHASLLPKYRGAGPIQWSVLNGDSETGVTTMLMAEGVDTGDILLKKSTPIDINETSGELFDRLSVMGAELLSETVQRLKKGDIVPQKQDESFSTHAPMLTKALSPIDWNCGALCVHNKVRGLSPWPSAVCAYRGKTLKIHKTRLTDKKGQTPGEILNDGKSYYAVCGDLNCLELVEVQYEGGKRMSADLFFRGHIPQAGEKLL